MEIGTLTHNLREIIDRSDLWADDSSLPSKLPWDDPGFSQRMLTEHLDQRHDMASRRLEIVDEHVTWIFDEMLGGRTGRVLDLGCGPGLYSERLARLGCTCHGIDFSPASIEYARSISESSGSNCTYQLADIRTAEFGSGYDLAMLLFGELNVFSRDEASDLLRRSFIALRPGGKLLIEPHTWDVIAGQQEPLATWSTSGGGLFSEEPYLLLTEMAWNDDAAATRTRFIVIDPESATVDVYGQELSAYRVEEYRELLALAGFTEIEVAGGFGEAHLDPRLMVITGSRT